MCASALVETRGQSEMTKPAASQLRPQITSGKLGAEHGRKISSNNSIPRHTHQPPAMASRRLALNLSRAVRTRAGPSVAGTLKRGFASHSSSKTQTTTLKNGLTVGRDNARPIGLAHLAFTTY